MLACNCGRTYIVKGRLIRVGIILKEEASDGGIVDILCLGHSHGHEEDEQAGQEGKAERSRRHADFQVR